MKRDPELELMLNGLSCPPLDLSKLTFAGSKASKVLEWVNSLRATQIHQTSVLLYKSIPEISRLKTDFKNRFDMLEAVRPSVQHCIVSLSKSFLRQPLILPDEAQKAAIVAQSLQKSMSDAYTQCVASICEQRKLKPAVLETLSTALHRAITGIGLVFLRSYQLYTQVPSGLWMRLHCLYQIAEYYDVQDTPIFDSLLKANRATSIQNAYVRILMMATAKSNQIGQNDVAACYDVFETWSQNVRVNFEFTDDPENFYAVNLSIDEPPSYKSRFDFGEDDLAIELDFQLVLAQLAKQSGASDDVVGGASSVKVPRDFSSSLLAHLLDTWGNVAQRKLERKDIQSSAEVCVGLVDCHYFACGGQNFDRFLGQEQSAQMGFGAPSSVGLTPLDAKKDGPSKPEKPVYRVALQNVSAGGYCLLWKGDIPSKVEAGELIGIKEVGRRTWNIGVVRWVRQLRQASQLGVQLISNQPKPYAAAQNYDMGGYSEYMRAIMVPPPKFGDTPVTVITGAAPFKEFDSVRFLDGDNVSSIKLDKCIFSTSNIRQFTFHSNEKPDAKSGVGSSQRNNRLHSGWENE